MLSDGNITLSIVCSSSLRAVIIIHSIAWLRPLLRICLSFLVLILLCQRHPGSSRDGKNVVSPSRRRTLCFLPLQRNRLASSIKTLSMSSMLSKKVPIYSLNHFSYPEKETVECGSLESSRKLRRINAAVQYHYYLKILILLI